MNIFFWLIVCFRESEVMRSILVSIFEIGS